MRKKWLVALLLVIALTCTGVTALAGTRQMKIEASIVTLILNAALFAIFYIKDADQEERCAHSR